MIGVVVPSPALATVDDLQKRMEDEIPDADVPRAQAVLDDASNLIRAVSGQSWVDATTGVITNDMVFTLVLKIARRAVLNPDGVSSETYPEYAWRKDGVEDGVYLTDSEVKLLRKLSGKSGLWTQPTTKLDCEDPTVYVLDGFNGDPLAMYDSYNVDNPWDEVPRV